MSIIRAALLYPICNFLCKKEVEAFPSDLIISSADWYNSSLSLELEELSPFSFSSTKLRISSI
jgi:hypothetical protein